MPMPHRTFAEVAKRRLVGKEGSARVAAIHALLSELPGYRNGPYADLRKWLEGELDRTRVRAKVTHRDSLQVRREGAAQIALVGPPNAGKSSLLQALSDIRIKTGDYAFTTLRPVPALTRIGGVLVQLVEIPGLIEGAHEDRGGGRALLGVLRNADAIVFCHAANEPPAALEVVRREVAAAAIDNDRASLCRSSRDSFRILAQVRSFLFFAARSEAAVSPPPTLIRLSDSRMPWVGIGARFELRVRELTPIQEISEDSRPYSIFGQRFITTLIPAASALAAAASSRAPSCIQITFGGVASRNASSTTGMM